MWPLLLLLAAAAVYAYGLRPVARWRLRAFPGPRPAWLLGNLAEVAARGKHTALARWAAVHGPVFAFWEGGVPTVVVQDPALARLVNSRLPHRHPIPSLERGKEAAFNAAGILFARGAYHRSLRAAWAPMFHARALAGFAPPMAAAAAALVRRLRPAAGSGAEVDVAAGLYRLTMQITGQTAFGVDLSGGGGGEGGGGAGGGEGGGAAAEGGGGAAEEAAADGGRLAAAATAFFEAAGRIEDVYAGAQVVFPFAAPAARALAQAAPTRAYAAGRAGRRVVRAFAARLVAAHRTGGGGKAAAPAARVQVAAAAGAEAQAAAAAAPAPAPPPPPAAPGSFLDLMARSTNRETGRPFSDAEVSAQAFSFVLAAYETTAAALAFMVDLVAAHPAVEARLLAEVDAFGRGRAPGAGDLAAFPYAAAVFKETLRLYPTVPLTIREAGPEGLRLGPRAVPPGTQLAVSLYGLHRDPRFWRDPEAFRPERFLADPCPPPAAAAAAAAGPSKEDGAAAAAPPAPARSALGDDLSAYMPFGDGARACIGQRYAAQEAVLAAAALYGAYTFRRAPSRAGAPARARMSLSLVPAGPVLVTVHARR